MQTEKWGPRWATLLLLMSLLGGALASNRGVPPARSVERQAVADRSLTPSPPAERQELGAPASHPNACAKRNVWDRRSSLTFLAVPTHLSVPKCSVPRLDLGWRLGPLLLSPPPGGESETMEVAAQEAEPPMRMSRGVAVPALPTAVAASVSPIGRENGQARLTTVAVHTIPGLPEPQETVPNTPIPVRLMETKSRILSAVGLRTVQIDDSTGAVAEVQPINDREVLLLAKGPGSTTVRIWDARGRTEYEVTVEPSPARRQQMIQEAIGVEGVTARAVEGTVILEGEVPSLEQTVRAQRIAEAFGLKVVNLLKVVPPAPEPRPVSLVEQVQAVLPPGEVSAEALPGQPLTVVLRGRAPRVEDMEAMVALAEKVVAPAKGAVVNLIQLADPLRVRIQARMVSVDERLLKELGVEWPEESTFTQMLNKQDVAGQFFPEGGLRLFTPLQATVKAMLEDSRTQVLAAPSLVVNSGAMGTIQVGGELPLPTVVTGITGIGGVGAVGQAGVGTVGQSVLFRPFGVQLILEPVVRPAGELVLRLVAESSAIDRNTVVNIGGTQIPGFTTKRAATEVSLKSGDTLVIGGLISKEEAEAVRRFPILADIPVLGAFFRSVRKEKQTRELFVFLTPDILPGPEPPAGLRQQPALKPGGLPSLTLPLGGGWGTGGGAYAPPGGGPTVTGGALSTGTVPPR